MSVSGILSSNLFNYQPQSVQSRMQQLQQEFQQLGKDLTTGSLTAAQTDFATLQQMAPQSSSATPQSTNPLQQAFSQLGQDLQAGNVSAAQQDYSNIQQDLQNQDPQIHGHHHHHGGGGENNQISQLFQQLGQDLQSGDLSSAQQAYGTLAQDLQVANIAQSPAQSSSSSTGSALSVNA